MDNSNVVALTNLSLSHIDLRFNDGKYIYTLHCYKTVTIKKNC